MLSNLKISNYAIIDNIDITFRSGFSVLTGETGAGKSIILGALNLITGGRFDSKSALKSGKKTVIEAVFNVQEFPLLEQVFVENDLDYDSTQCILRREITPEGKSRVFVNDTPSTLSVVKNIAMQLIDIHSQHANAQLSDPDFQLYILDIMADNSTERKIYTGLYEEYVAKRKELRNLKERIAEAEKEMDYNRFVYNQLYDLNLQDGEEEQLEEAQLRLSNVQQIKETLWAVIQILDNESSSACSALTTAAHRIDSIASVFADASDFSSRLESMAIDVRDIIDSVEKLNDEIIDDPHELERVEARIAAIIEQKRKHSVTTVRELLDLQTDLEKKINLTENSQIELDRLRKELIDLKQKLKSAADNITESRINAARIFEDELVKLARPLGLQNIRCRFNFVSTEFSQTGCDGVELQIAINKNQEFSSIATSASGGEMSRMMLCIKWLLARSISLPTVIFDEIDTGVSGEIAGKMADMMKQMSEKMQVIAITHLPQVAAKGDTHYKVFKTDTDESTVTSIEMVKDNARIMEIAGMLGDSRIGDAAINNAKALLGVN